MADDLSLIVPIGADMTGLAQGIAEAGAALRRFETQAKAAATASAASAAEVVRAAVQPYALAGEAVNKWERRATAASERVAAGQRAVFGTLARSSESATNELERFAKRANVLLAIQGASAGVNFLRASWATLNGEFEKSQSFLERFPFGLGDWARTVREVGEEFNGVAERQRESLRIIQQAKEDTAEWERRARMLGEVLAGESANKSSAMLGRNDFAGAQAEMEADLKRRTDRKRYELLKEGNDRVIVERAIALQIAEEKKNIEEKVAEERRRREEAALDRARRIDKNEKADAARIAKQAEEAARARRDAERDALNAQRDALREELQQVSRIQPQNFIQRSSTALGSFTSAQGGAAASVAKAAQRQVELTMQLKNIAQKIEQNQRDPSLATSWN